MDLRRVHSLLPCKAKWCSLIYKVYFLTLVVHSTTISANTAKAATAQLCFQGSLASRLLRHGSSAVQGHEGALVLVPGVHGDMPEPGAAADGPVTQGHC